MISIVLGGDTNDASFKRWLQRLPQVQYLNLREKGALAFFAKWSVGSSLVIKVKDYITDEITYALANDSIVLHVPSIVGEDITKVIACIEIALSSKLDIQAYLYEKQPEKISWSSNWPELQEVIN